MQFTLVPVYQVFNELAYGFKKFLGRGRVSKNSWEGEGWGPEQIDHSNKLLYTIMLLVQLHKHARAVSHACHVECTRRPEKSNFTVLQFSQVKVLTNNIITLYTCTATINQELQCISNM